MWSIPGLDLDLYVWHHQGANPLFYRNTVSPEGVFVHDYRDRNDTSDYEKVILNEPPNSMESLRVFVNFYEGATTSPVTGKVFVRYQSKTYAGTFSIPAKQGNKGSDISERSRSPYWAEVLTGELQPVGP